MNNPLANHNFNRTQRAMLSIAAFVIIVAGMRAAQDLLVPFLLSVFIAVLTFPLLTWLRSRGVPSWVAILLVVSLILGIGTGIGALIGTSLNDFTNSIPAYQRALTREMSDAVDWVQNHGVNLSDEVIFEYIDPGAAMRLTSRLLSGLGSVLGDAFLILLTVVFMLLEATQFGKKLEFAMGGSQPALDRFNTFFENINHYMVLKTIISLATGLTATILLLILGVDYALLWGLLTFLLNYIPNIGSIMASIPPILLSLVLIGPWAAIATGIGYLTINTVFGTILEPRVMGRGLGLSTLIVFLSLLFWGWVLGPLGMLLSVPLTMTAKIALSSSEDTQWLSRLLDSGVPVREPSPTVDDNLGEG